MIGIFSGKSFKKAVGYSVLFRFVEAVKSSVIFSTTPQQQKEIIFAFVSMSRLVDDALEADRIMLEELARMMSENYQSKNTDKTLQSIYESIDQIKKIAPKKSHYDEFSVDIKKSWVTNIPRKTNSKNDQDIRADDVLKTTRDSGGFFVTALIHLLGPRAFPADLQKAIYLCGGWFQILDDYRDRKEDRDDTITLFTIPQDKSPIEILKERSKQYEKEIQNIPGDQRGLIEFMRKLTALVRMSDFTKSLIDW